jgi:hypothetical protein
MILSTEAIVATQIDSRLRRLETRSAVKTQAFVFRAPGETTEEAVAARYPEGLPADSTLVVLQWLESSDEVPTPSIAGMKPADGGEYGGKHPEDWR